MADEETTSTSDDTTEDAEAQNLLADAVVDQDDDAQPDTGSGEGADLKAEVERLRSESEKWRNLARKHEGRAKENANAASKAKSVEQQLDDLRSQMSERDVRDVERSGRMALSQLHTRLAEAGIKRDDVAGVLERFEPTQLLRNGEPDEDAIGKFAESLTRIAGRVSPDPDQGKRGGQPTDMTSLIRQQAGLGA